MGTLYGEENDVRRGTTNTTAAWTRWVSRKGWCVKSLWRSATAAR